MIGSGAIIVVDDSHGVLEVAMKVATFYEHESCGKCVPCRDGTRWTLRMFHRVASGAATPMDLDIMPPLQEQILGNCLCPLGDVMAMPIGALIAKFRGERLRRRGPDPARERQRRVAQLDGGRRARRGRELTTGGDAPHQLGVPDDGRERRAGPPRRGSRARRRVTY
jgi:hypothetical protein